MIKTNERINGDYYYCLVPGDGNGSASSLGEIGKPAGPVPLYLVPQALSKEIHELKDAIVGVRVEMLPRSYVCSFAASLQQFCSNLLQSKIKDEGGSFVKCCMNCGDSLSKKCSLRKNSGHRRTILRRYILLVVCVRPVLLQT
ncbi:hypothetical protein [Methanolacinia paynteri]|uniref:hypothetical protein n=1 Tax=Methanolacinia paynteri TaxID=230356 RepID=UPI0012F6D221|nr:hypothetical protein [Methanolacinia paynteri]